MKQNKRNLQSMKKNKELENYEKAVMGLTKLFIKKYFNDAEFYFIGDEIGGVVDVNDYFFGFDDIVNFIKYDYSEDDLFKYYDYCLEMNNACESPLNIRTWRELKK